MHRLDSHGKVEIDVSVFFIKLLRKSTFPSFPFLSSVGAVFSNFKWLKQLNLELEFV